MLNNSHSKSIKKVKRIETNSKQNIKQRISISHHYIIGRHYDRVALLLYFGSLATLISTQFFPKENPAAAFLATLATYAVGLVVRPSGALFFGRLGNLIGKNT